MSTISCKIRGLRDPETRTEQALRPLRQPQEQHFDDGTRLVRIIGCEYRLLESEILDWLSLYGDVISEITEEPYLDADEPEDGLPPIGNGTYLVKMKMRRDMPNWVPMYGRKVCFSYRGIKKQCNSCFGPHLRKYCKNEKMTLEEYTDKFRPRNKYVPEQLYGRLAKLENIAEQQRKLIESETIPPLQSSGSVSGSNHGPTRPLAARNMTTEAPQVKQTKAAQGRVVINLRRKEGDVWSTKQPILPGPEPATNPALNVNQSIGSVAENVTSFLSGIRASFRSDNVNVLSMNQQKKNCPEKNQQ